MVVANVISTDSSGWRIRIATGDDGSLTDREIERLAADHGIQIDALERLSIGLDIALDPRRGLMREDMKPLQKEKAAKQVTPAIDDLDAAEKRLLSAGRLLEAVSFKSPIAHIALNPSSAHIESLTKPSPISPRSRSTCR